MPSAINIWGCELTYKGQGRKIDLKSLFNPPKTTGR
jgi:hypothetical protein